MAEIAMRRECVERGDVHNRSTFNLGDEVEDEIMGPGFVIGLPTADAPHAAAEGAAGQVWLHLATGEYAWRMATQVKLVSRKRRTSPRLASPTCANNNGANHEGAGQSSSAQHQTATVNMSHTNSTSISVNLFARASGRESSCSSRSPIAPQPTVFGQSASAAGKQHAVPPAFGVPLAGIERVRKPCMKPPSGARGRAKERGVTTKETGVKISQRLEEFPNQGFKEAPAGRLFCKPCKEQLLNLKNSIKQHVKTEKHVKNVRKFGSRAAEDKAVAQDMCDYFNAHNDEAGVSCNAHCPHLRLSRRMRATAQHVDAPPSRLNATALAGMLAARRSHEPLPRSRGLSQVRNAA